uniref:Uncharacterized protein n=1 Tax=uncultured SAR11 cluster alpha proteobacterium H17925_45G17 TaxID=715038 RepID=E7CA42_9PROT|nr:hypothetical protein [uncultured SAR11 cluster alpha proteobacterium H17925_45G17]
MTSLYEQLGQLPMPGFLCCDLNASHRNENEVLPEAYTAARSNMGSAYSTTGEPDWTVRKMRSVQCETCSDKMMWNARGRGHCKLCGAAGHYECKSKKCKAVLCKSCCRQRGIHGFGKEEKLPIDFIFYSERAFAPSSVLQLPRSCDPGCLPNAGWPSDHLSLRSGFNLL